MKSNSIISIIFFGVVLALSGCASIISGSNQTITIDSYPQGAEVVISGLTRGLTPLTVPVSREYSEVGTVIVKKEGYEPQTITLSHKLNPWFWGNIVIGGVLGSSTDSTTGARYAYEPGQYMANLVAIPKPQVETPQAAPAEPAVSPAQ